MSIDDLKSDYNDECTIAVRQKEICIMINDVLK